MFGRKKQGTRAGAVAQTVPRPLGGGLSSLFPRNEVMTRAERELYASLRESVPLIDAAIGKLVRLTGSFRIASDSAECERTAADFIRRVRVGGSERACRRLFMTISTACSPMAKRSVR